MSAYGDKRKIDETLHQDTGTKKPRASDAADADTDATDAAMLGGARSGVDDVAGTAGGDGGVSSLYTSLSQLSGAEEDMVPPPQQNQSQGSMGGALATNQTPPLAAAGHVPQFQIIPAPAAVRPQASPPRPRPPPQQQPRGPRPTRPISTADLVGLLPQDFVERTAGWWPTTWKDPGSGSTSQPQETASSRPHGQPQPAQPPHKLDVFLPAAAAAPASDLEFGAPPPQPEQCSACGVRTGIMVDHPTPHHCLCEECRRENALCPVCSPGV